MSKIFIVEDCTKCPNFIPCTSPKDFRVGCTKLGNLGSPLNLIGGGFPIDCPLNDYEEPKTGHWVDDNDGYGTSCSKCGKWYTHPYLTKQEIIYCCKCGAKMIEPQESEDKE